MPQQFDNVSVVCKANIYFNGGVVSHSVIFKDGTRKTLGLIYPGTYNFNTDAAEKMEILSGTCRVKIAGQHNWTDYGPDTAFDVPGKSSFEIESTSSPTEYICSFLA